MTFSHESLYAAQDRILVQVFENTGVLLGEKLVILGGGTALARYFLHHRISYDLDFFVAEEFSPDRLLRNLKSVGLPLEEVQIVPGGGRYAAQLHGYARAADGTPVKISFIEDFLAGMFETIIVDQGVITEEIEGLYHRKLKTITGAKQEETVTGAPINVGGRQTVRDLFDIYVLSKEVMPMRGFVRNINSNGAGLNEDSLLQGLRLMPWKDMLDEFNELERAEKYAKIGLIDIKRHLDEEAFSTIRTT